MPRHTAAAAVRNPNPPAPPATQHRPFQSPGRDVRGRPSSPALAEDPITRTTWSAAASMPGRLRKGRCSIGGGGRPQGLARLTRQRQSKERFARAVRRRNPPRFTERRWAGGGKRGTRVAARPALRYVRSGARITTGRPCRSFVLVRDMAQGPCATTPTAGTPIHPPLPQRTIAHFNLWGGTRGPPVLAGPHRMKWAMFCRWRRSSARSWRA